MGSDTLNWMALALLRGKGHFVRFDAEIGEVKRNYEKLEMIVFWMMQMRWDGNDEKGGEWGKGFPP